MSLIEKYSAGLLLDVQLNLHNEFYRGEKQLVRLLLLCRLAGFERSSREEKRREAIKIVAKIDDGGL